MTQTVPFPPYALIDDIVLCQAESGSNHRVWLILSRHHKRSDLPDQSAIPERAQWIGQRGKIREVEVEFVDALLYENIWYVQYSEVQQ